MIELALFILFLLILIITANPVFLIIPLLITIYVLVSSDLGVTLAAFLGLTIDLLSPGPLGIYFFVLTSASLILRVLLNKYVQVSVLQRL